MLFNHPRALARMDTLGLDALVAGVARNVHYASGFWTRNFEWGSQEALSAVIIPRDPAKPPTLIVPEFAIGNPRANARKRGQVFHFSWPRLTRFLTAFEHCPQSVRDLPEPRESGCKM
jgi:Xaa-Pro aminopeptidase